MSNISNPLAALMHPVRGATASSRINSLKNLPSPSMSTSMMSTSVPNLSASSVAQPVSIQCSGKPKNCTFHRRGVTGVTPTAGLHAERPKGPPFPVMEPPFNMSSLTTAVETVMMKVPSPTQRTLEQASLPHSNLTASLTSANVDALGGPCNLAKTQPDRKCSTVPIRPDSCIRKRGTADP
ncbi:hypothetical protein QJS04_geneDACA004471 [Acorus gramineus]|uniref:Uncharacterized protein n=1 Tax=Acorus gramineus TaxID=55184 RepID=A0AAV9B4Q2_ACOGR|nr:hypothetical protein QJS04_geneDACA004471 [Acorus gramineus]